MTEMTMLSEQRIRTHIELMNRSMEWVAEPISKPNKAIKITKIHQRKCIAGFYVG